MTRFDELAAAVRQAGAPASSTVLPDDETLGRALYVTSMIGALLTEDDAGSTSAFGRAQWDRLHSSRRAHWVETAGRLRRELNR